ncbi:hypothetical protein [Thermoactinospora rubra]|uniref:hypothetical protein n=1 Tax=Thermoactinospora rubra TaxID=1088767 RepID=UPI0011811C7D|nr:hypothetical protein [Thermoactinospora rubra]
MSAQATAVPVSGVKASRPLDPKPTTRDQDRWSRDLKPTIRDIRNQGGWPRDLKPTVRDDRDQGGWPRTLKPTVRGNNDQGGYSWSRKSNGHQRDHVHNHKRGPRGPQGPRGLQGPPGPAGSSVGIDTAPHGGNKFIGVVRSGGQTWIRDPRGSGPYWYNLSGLSGYPRSVVDVTLATLGDSIAVTVLTSTGGVYQTRCAVTHSDKPDSWPKNCTAFINHTPPNM